MRAGDKAPEFTLPDQEGDPISLSDFRGQKVVLYFYPKDDTPGCTKEACSFRDNFASLEKEGIVVLGVSPDEPESHSSFIEKYSLPFRLLSDPSHEVMEAYGAWGEKNLYGNITEGVLRRTYLIDGDGMIVHIFKRPKVDVHAEEVLEKFS